MATGLGPLEKISARNVSAMIAGSVHRTGSFIQRKERRTEAMTTKTRCIQTTGNTKEGVHRLVECAKMLGKSLGPSRRSREDRLRRTVLLLMVVVFFILNHLK